MQTDKSGIGPKPSTNGGKPRPSDGWFRGKAQPALFMNKKMKKESCFHEDIDIDPYEKVAKEMVYLMDIRPGSRGENSDRSQVEQETMRLVKRFFGETPVDWHRMSELAKNFVQRLYRNYSAEYIMNQEARLDSLLTYLGRYSS